MRDVGRTFPTHPFFTATNAPGEAILARILKASLRFRPDVGYCQGMNFVVAALILARFHEISPLAACSEGCNLTTEIDLAREVEICYDPPNYEAESDIFWLFQSLLSPLQSDGSFAPAVTRISSPPKWLIPDGKMLCMASIWTHGFPKMKLRVYQFDRLFQWNLPQISEHLVRLGLSTEVVVSQWFMTVFAYAFPVQDLFYVWDYIFTSSWRGIHKLTLAILFVLRDSIVDMDLEKVGLLLRDWKKGDFVFPVSISELLQRAEMFVVTEDMLSTLHESYGLDILTTARESKRIQAAVAGGLTEDEERERERERERDSDGILKDVERRSSVNEFRKSFREKDRESYRDIDRERLTDRGSMGIPRPGGPAWLQCLGDISVEMIQEMEATSSELAELDIELEKQKEFIQKQIVNACDASERSSSSLVEMEHQEKLWYEKVVRLDRMVSKWQNRFLALSQGCPAVVKRVDDDEIGDADWEDDCKLADEFEAIVNGGFDDEESDATLSISGSERSPIKGLSKSHSWPDYTTSDDVETVEFIEPLTDSLTTTSPKSMESSPSDDSEHHLELSDLITTLTQKKSLKKKEVNETSFDRSTSSGQSNHGWMTHQMTKHFRSFHSSSKKRHSSISSSTNQFVEIFGTHNLASPSLRSQLQKSDEVVVSRALLSNRYPSKYIHRFKKTNKENTTLVLDSSPEGQVMTEMSMNSEQVDDPNADIPLPSTSSPSSPIPPLEDNTEKSDSENGNTEVVPAKSTFRRPFLPLRRSISLSLRTGFGRFLGTTSKEIISSVPTGIDTIKISLSRNREAATNPSPASLAPEIPPIPITPKVVRDQRIQRMRDRKHVMSRHQTQTQSQAQSQAQSESWTRTNTNTKTRREISQRVSHPQKILPQDEALLESQSQTLREMQQRVVKLTRALEVAKLKYQTVQSNYQKSEIADEEMKKWKEIVCEQYQTILHEFSAKRSQKLIYIAEKYGM